MVNWKGILPFEAVKIYIHKQLHKCNFKILFVGLSTLNLMPRKLPKILNELFLPIKLITHHLYYNCDEYL